MNELALFAGAGGGILGGKLLGWKTVCAVEINTYAASILIQRQNDKILEPFPIWDDISTFDGKPWKKNIDVVSGGFPCQDISAAGKKTGITGERSGLWSQMFRIICEVESPFVFVENSPLLTLRGLDRVLGDLASVGYNAAWGVLGGKHFGLPHNRERLWIFAADSSKQRSILFFRWAAEIRRKLDEHYEIEPSIARILERLEEEGKQCSNKAEDSLPSYLCRVDDGMAHNVDRIKCIGNGQIPRVAKGAWEILFPPGQ